MRDKDPIMETAKNRSEVVEVREVESVTPRPTISTHRWTRRPTHPRLVSLSWAAVAPMNSQR
jgi:hypothetical protein